VKNRYFLHRQNPQKPADDKWRANDGWVGILDDIIIIADTLSQDDWNLINDAK
jgi:hypothetical protein